jgi:hypothetical protein
VTIRFGFVLGFGRVLPVVAGGEVVSPLWERGTKTPTSVTAMITAKTTASRDLISTTVAAAV